MASPMTLTSLSVDLLGTAHELRHPGGKLRDWAYVKRRLRELLHDEPVEDTDVRVQWDDGGALCSVCCQSDWAFFLSRPPQPPRIRVQRLPLLRGYELARDPAAVRARAALNRALSDGTFRPAAARGARGAGAADVAEDEEEVMSVASGDDYVPGVANPVAARSPPAKPKAPGATSGRESSRLSRGSDSDSATSSSGRRRRRAKRDVICQAFDLSGRCYDDCPNIHTEDAARRHNYRPGVNPRRPVGPGDAGRRDERRDDREHRDRGPNPYPAPYPGPAGAAGYPAPGAYSTVQLGYDPYAGYPGYPAPPRGQYPPPGYGAGGQQGARRRSRTRSRDRKRAEKQR